jgi:hypothetical protein
MSALSQHPERFAQSVADVRRRTIQIETDQRDPGLQKYRIEQLVSFLPIAHLVGTVIEFYRQYNLESFAADNEEIDVFLTDTGEGRPPITPVKTSYFDQVRHANLGENPEILPNHCFKRVKELEFGGA